MRSLLNHSLDYCSLPTDISFHIRISLYKSLLIEFFHLFFLIDVLVNLDYFFPLFLNCYVLYLSLLLEFDSISFDVVCIFFSVWFAHLSGFLFLFEINLLCVITEINISSWLFLGSGNNISAASVCSYRYIHCFCDSSHFGNHLLIFLCLVLELYFLSLYWHIIFYIFRHLHYFLLVLVIDILLLEL